MSKKENAVINPVCKKFTFYKSSRGNPYRTYAHSDCLYSLIGIRVFLVPTTATKLKLKLEGKL